MNSAAKKSTQTKINQILCVQTANLTSEESKKLKKELQYFYDFLNFALGYYNNWLYSNSKSKLLTIEDEKIIPKFIDTKHDLYSLLWGRDVYWYFLSKKLDKKDFEALENEYFSIYLSLYKLHFEFYSSLSKEYRKEILRLVNEVFKQ
ncbi:MAG: hypothetical protein H7A23_12405 [Leptospiraceae bacterium]|nr:hypothetical protein [Leptospiraceae bacterium]MCP5495350.1 hypothetical protein [Leptospiraceae bacterium]